MNNNDARFVEGDFVSLIPLFRSKKNNKFVIRLRRNEKFHSKYGIISHDDIIGKLYGAVISTHLNYRFIAIPAALHEVVQNYRRFKYITQIIYPRDWAIICVFADIKEGDRIIEIGTGSGAFLAYLTRIVGSSGYIYSYEKDPQRAKMAIDNLNNIGISERFSIKIRDVAEKGVDEKNVDVVFIDVPEPWLIVRKTWCALKPGGRIVVYVPTFNQLEKTIRELMKNGFIDIKIKEGFLRDIQVKPYAIRPELRGYYFSAYIVFARKSLVIPLKYLMEIKKFKELGD